jgi:hypothetical protein
MADFLGRFAQPTEPYFLFAAADVRYFRVFGPALALSAAKLETPLHLHVVNPVTDEDVRLMSRIVGLTENGKVTVSYDFAPQPTSELSRRVCFACLRHHKLPELLANPSTRGIFVIDIDSLVNRKIDFSSFDRPLGLYVRDPFEHGAKNLLEMKGLRCLGCFWVDGRAVEYALAVSAYISERMPGYWFLDQEALFECYLQRHDKLPLLDLSAGPYIDWEFREHTYLWTGKGKRKYLDATYVARFDALTGEFNSLPSTSAPSQPGAPRHRKNAATLFGDIGELPRLPDADGCPIRWDLLEGLHVEAVSEPPVVRGQRILRLAAVGEDCRHAVGVHYPALASGEVCRAAAWAKLAPGARVMVEARDGFDRRTGKPSNYGLALFDLGSAGVIETSGDIMGSGVEAEVDGWLKLWVETRSKDGQAFVLAGLIEGENNRHIFTAAGQQLTLGGWEIALR